MIQCRIVARNYSTNSINHFKIKCLRFVVVWFLLGIGKILILKIGIIFGIIILKIGMKFGIRNYFYLDWLI